MKNADFPVRKLLNYGSVSMEKLDLGSQKWWNTFDFAINNIKKWWIVPTIRWKNMDLTIENRQICESTSGLHHKKMVNKISNLIIIHGENMGRSSQHQLWI